MFAYNTSVHEATSSFSQGTELENYRSYLHDRIVRITEIQKTAHKNLIKVKSRSKEQYDKDIRPLNAKIGDTVYAFKEVRDGTFDSRVTGLYTVAGFAENNSVILETGLLLDYKYNIDKLTISNQGTSNTVIKSSQVMLLSPSSTWPRDSKENL